MKTTQSTSNKLGWFSWLFLAAGLLAAAIVYWQGSAMVARELSSQLDFRAREAQSSLERQVSIYAEVLRGLQAQFVANPDLSRRAFQQVATTLDLNHRLPGVQATAFTRKYAASERAQVAASQKAELLEDNPDYPAFSMPAATSSAEMMLVQYIEPIAKNHGGAWFDQGADPKRRIAIERARDSGEWSVSGRVRLFVAPGNIDGIVFFLPIYRGGTVPATVEERREKFHGTVLLAVRVDDMLRNIFGPKLLDDLAIRIVEQSGPGPQSTTDKLIFNSASYRDKAALSANNDSLPLTRRLLVAHGGNAWEVIVTALPKFASTSQQWLPVIAAFAAVVLSLLVFFFMRTLDYSRRVAHARTREIARSLDSREKQLNGIVESIDQVLWTFEMPAGTLNYVSPAAERVYGHPVGAFYANPRLWLECVHPDDRIDVLAASRELVDVGRKTLQYRIVRPDGEIRWMRYDAHFIPGAVPGSGRIDSVGSDITEQYRLEQSLHRSNRALRAIHECEAIIIDSKLESALLQGICEVIAKCGYRMAWAGIRNTDGGEGIAQVAAAGLHQDYVGCISAALDAGVHGDGLIASALRSRMPSVANRFDSDPRLMRWRTEALRRGFNSMIALPLLHEDEMLGILNVYAAEQDAFDAEEVDLLAGLVQGISGAIAALRYRSRHQAVKVELRLFKRAIEASANAIVITSATGPEYPVEYVNPAFERMTGYAAHEMLGHSLRVLRREDANQAGVQEIRATLREQRTGQAVIRNYRKDGTLFWSEVFIAPVKDESGAVSHFVAAKYDVTETKRYQAELEFQANHDALTALANRNLLHDRLCQAIIHAEHHDYPMWVVFIDLDRFKFVNDTLGHQAGDTLLKHVAERLLHAVRETDTVARLGGDEFVLLLSERGAESPGAGVVQRIMDAIAKPFVIEQHEFFLTSSIGIAVYPNDGLDADTLIKHADVAMYRAKETGRNNFQFYTPEMNQRALERLRIEGDLRLALERDEFLLHYQPQVDLHTGLIVGMEALIRWSHPTRGLVSPANFINLAEETGLIVPIGDWVMRTACRQNKAWQRAGHAPLRVAVNLSAAQFAQHDLVQSITAALEDAGLEPQYLEIELTESLVMTDVARTIGVLQELKTLGVHLSIDDFGTGYSSLSYLKRFPINVLKIDQSFVRDITVNPDDAAIVASIISLAHSLRLDVIAEGVETEDQLAFLWRNGCDQIQGYYFSRPVPGEAAEKLLRQGENLLLCQSALA
ncbi:EAL domain-containing protein [Herminiimonas sp. CN]|uniref:bifunctional diguanylate cyclase/phosphodiesterase n=1 Tax=Herminiimonas sp. CN TaxID=1349818 RepID=UPI0004732287|nr:EAL domain-containing protein [Herminiimonas sp. CN]